MAHPSQPPQTTYPHRHSQCRQPRGPRLHAPHHRPKLIRKEYRPHLHPWQAHYNLINRDRPRHHRLQRSISQDLLVKIHFSTEHTNKERPVRIHYSLHIRGEESPLTSIELPHLKQQQKR